MTIISMRRKITFILNLQVPTTHTSAYDNEYEERPQEKLEHVIMEEILKQEKKPDGKSSLHSR